MNKTGLVVNSLFYRTLGRLSEGVNMTFDLGLTSGRVLDYIYENKPHGRTFIGKWIDKQYIGHPGWEAVRTRKGNLESALKLAVESLQRGKDEITIVDIASGCAAYLFSVIADINDNDITARCYDIDARWVELGNQKAANLGMKSITFQQGNMMDLDFAKKAMHDADVVICAGFFDWIWNDEEILKSLNIIKSSTPPSAYILLTYQMAHPCLDLVQHVFKNFNGTPLEMKMRSANEMGQILNAANVKVVHEQSDKFGYYNTVLGRF
jgi:SAM-dependent methyltransferase